MFYEDRGEAADKLEEKILENKIEPDTVLGVIEGGIPIGRKLSDSLNANFDFTFSKDIRAPGKPGVIIGSAATDGTLWLKEDLYDTRCTDREKILELKEKAAERARRRLKKYRGDKKLDLRGEEVMIVDEGVEDTSRIAACIGQARKAGAEKVYVAVPVAPRYAVQKLNGISDGTFSVKTPRFVDSLDDYYSSRKKIDRDEAARHILGNSS